jgi:hypothetical protein
MEQFVIKSGITQWGNVDTYNLIIPNDKVEIFKANISQHAAETFSRVIFNTPSIVSNITNYAFEGCKMLEGITIPYSVTTIGRGAFKNCTSLQKIAFGGNLVNEIKEDAFYGCSSLATITIPDSVTSIGGSAFWGCTSLASINILDGVIIIGKRAFNGCRSLKSITIPDSVISIGMNAFLGCRGIKVTINNITLKTIIQSNLGKYGLIEDQIIDGSNPTGGGNKSKKSTKKKKTKSTKKKKTKSAKKKKKKTKSIKKKKKKNTTRNK